MRTKVRLPPSWTKLRYHPLQAEAFYAKKRFVNLACGRGSGKTEIARRKVVLSLAYKKPWPDPKYFFALPTYAQAKRVAWKPLLDLIPKNWIKNINVMDMTIETKFGSTLYVYGLDQPQRVEGQQYDGGIIDESSDQKPKVFDLSIRPALATKRGWCWRIGVPKRFGIGAIEYKEWYDRGLDPEFPDIVSYSWPSSDIIDPIEISDARHEMDPRDFREQYEASWETAGGAIFYGFDLKENVKPATEIKYDPNLPIVVGCDFNVSPMCWVFGHATYCPVTENKILNIFDELHINNTNTPECVEEVRRRYGNHTAGFVFYGDAASRQRKTSASKSDYLLLRNSNLPNLKIEFPKMNPPILDRFAACNAAFCNAANERRVFISSACQYLIRDLRTRVFKENTMIPEDADPESGHMSDAFGYMAIMEYPMKITSRRAPRYATRTW